MFTLSCHQQSYDLEQALLTLKAKETNTVVNLRGQGVKSAKLQQMPGYSMFEEQFPVILRGQPAFSFHLNVCTQNKITVGRMSHETAMVPDIIEPFFLS